MSYIYLLFEHLLRFWMGIWLQTHTVTTTDASPDLWELAETLPDASVQTMPQHFGWDCRTFQIVSHVHVIHIWEVWVPSQVVDGHLVSHSHRSLHRHFPIFVIVGWNPTSLSIIYLRELTFTVSYVQTYQDWKPPLQINYCHVSPQPWCGAALAPTMACVVMTPLPSA